jgi:hypothetical protein
MCWPNDVHKAKANVVDIRRIVQVKDSFIEPALPYLKVLVSARCLCDASHRHEIALP